MDEQFNRIRITAQQARETKSEHQEVLPLDANVFFNMTNIYNLIQRRALQGYKYIDYEVSAFESRGGAVDPYKSTANIQRRLINDGFTVYVNGYVLRIIWADTKPAATSVPSTGRGGRGRGRGGRGGKVQ